MNAQTMKNILEVREEAHVMLDNITKTQGRQHAALVRGLLLSSQSVQMVSFLLHCGVPKDEEIAKTIGDSFMNMLHGMLTSFVVAGQIPDEVVRGAIRDADSLDSSLSDLLKTAIKTAEAGKGFGDRGAE
jgi:hypothetical protein